MPTKKVIRIPLQENYEIWVLLEQVDAGMARARENETRPYGISMMQVRVLSLLQAVNEPITPTAIARLLFREPHTVSQLLGRMEKQGLIRRIRSRKRDPEDHGLVRVMLTDKGKEFFQEQSGSRKVIHEILSCLSPEERASFKSCLEKLREKTLEALAVRPDWVLPQVRSAAE